MSFVGAGVKAVLFQSDGTPRRRARPLYFKKNGALRPPFADWRSVLAPQSNSPTEPETSHRALNRIRQIVFVTRRSQRREAVALLAELKASGLRGRLQSFGDPLADDELYVVVDPSAFRDHLPPSRTIYAFSGPEPLRRSLAMGDDRLRAAPAVFVSRTSMIPALEKSGVPLAKIHCAPLPGHADATLGRLAETAPAFWSEGRLCLRALFGIGALSFEAYLAATSHGPPPSDTLLLCLPEQIERFAYAMGSLLPGAVPFPGLRHPCPWQGCAASYKYLALRALANETIPLTIYEDDAVFGADGADRLSAIRKSLGRRPTEWDIFSGLISDLAEEATLTRRLTEGGETFIFFDTMIGLVFSILNRRAIEALSRYTVEGDDPMVDTIDRFLERQDLVSVTTQTLLVQHSEELMSSLWTWADTKRPRKNSENAPAIAASLARIRRKLAQYDEASERNDRPVESA